MSPRAVPLALLGLATTAAVATAAAGPNVKVQARAGYGGGTCVDVTVDGKLVQDTICPPPSDLAVRTLSSGAYTIYYGATHRRVILTFRRNRVIVTPTADGVYAVAVKGTPPLGAIKAGSAERDVDPFGLPGRRATVLTVTDESHRRARLVAAAPKILSGAGRKRALCTGLQLPGAASPGRTSCATNRRRFVVRFSSKCAEKRQLIYGFAPASIRSARALSTDGGTRPLKVTRIPRRVGRPGVVVTGLVTGAPARTVKGYASNGRELASVTLTGGCSASKTRSKIR